jgi:hypothetical protein
VDRTSRSSDLCPPPSSRALNERPKAEDHHIHGITNNGSTMTTEASFTCRVCGEESSLKCSRCKIVINCSRDHQEADWKGHTCKLNCFPPGAVCTRCNEPAQSSTKCQVPHPPHMLEDAGSGFGDGAHFPFVCGACNRGFTRASPE